MTITLEQVGVISAGGIDVMSIDMTRELDADETISSVSSVTEVDTSNLMLDGKTVKTQAWTHKDGHAVAANKGVQVNVTAGSETGTYRVRWLLVTSLSRTLPLDTLIAVV